MLSFSSCPTTGSIIQPRAGQANMYFSHLPTGKKVCNPVSTWELFDVPLVSMMEERIKLQQKGKS